MNIGKVNIRRRYIVIAIVAIICLLVSLLIFFQTSRGIRYMFYFESLDDTGLFTEIRYLHPYAKDQTDSELIKQYADDLLLGPVTNRFKNIFASGTRINACMLRGSTVFVDLSSEALLPDNVTSSIKDGTEIFTYCIKKNFPQVETVEIFINGIRVYENEASEYYSE